MCKLSQLAMFSVVACRSGELTGFVAKRSLQLHGDSTEATRLCLFSTANAQRKYNREFGWSSSLFRINHCAMRNTAVVRGNWAGVLRKGGEIHPLFTKP